MLDLHSVPVVSLEFLFNNVLPPVPPTVDLEKLKANLLSKNVVRKNGWRGFETPPNNFRKKEGLVFQPFVRVFNDVLKSVSRDETLSAVLQMKHSPDPTPFSKRTNKSRPDAFLELLKRKSVNVDVRNANSSWEDISVSMEFKKSDSHRDKHDVSGNVSFISTCLL